MTGSRCREAALVLYCAWAAPAGSNDAVAPLGKLRAGASPLAWDVREAGHPALGNILFAVLVNPVETAVGSDRVFSRVYVSCQKAGNRLAIELTNTVAPDDPGGLKPASMPRLVCNRPLDSGGRKLAREPILASWEVNAIGDAMAQGLRAFPLRECVSIGIEQEVVLPPGWARNSARIEFEIAPYARDLDPVFAACGEASAYATASQAAPASARVGPANASPAKAKPAQEADGWRTARAVSNGKTNVRASPTLRSAVVVALHPGSILLAQRADAEWWRVKSRSGPKFEGYVRGDRLVFK